MVNVLITGGTGLVGSHLLGRLKEKGHQLYVLTRSDKASEDPSICYVNWQKDGWGQSISEQIDMVINLAGATLNHQWTESYKEKILDSRKNSTQALLQFFNSKNYAPKVLFSASAIGYYPASRDRAFDESDDCLPHDFLSEVVDVWENEARKFQSHGTRVIVGRFGVILASEGGALSKMAMPYRFFVGGKIGDGQQWMSWVHVEDVARAIMYLIEDEEASGAYNISSPHPVTQDQFGQTIGEVLGRPHLIPAPEFALKAVLGEQSALVLDSQKILPNRLLQTGFTFRYPTIQLALGDTLSQKQS